MIVVDTLRADRLGVYGGPKDLTPFFDQVAASGVYFAHAYAQSSWTNPSTASLLTSRYQSQHGVVTYASRLQPDETTLAEIFRANGYATGGFSANVMIGEINGFSQGFETFRSYQTETREGVPKAFWPPRRAEFVNAAALAWLDGVPRERPAFLYLHYMEPHAPYWPTQAAIAAVFGPDAAPDLLEINAALTRGYRREPAPEIFADIRRAYDAEVRSIDDGIRALFDALAKRGILDDAIIVITSDHGEEFREHGQFGHGTRLFDEVIRVPLIMRWPGAPRGRRIEPVVELVDVAPTVLQLAGITPPAMFTGESLAGLLGVRGAPTPNGAGRALSELDSYARIDARITGPHRRALVVDGRKVIAGWTPEEIAYFDLATDPTEQAPDALTPEARTSLDDALAAEAKGLTATAETPSATLPVPEATRERLRALGYAD